MNKKILIELSIYCSLFIVSEAQGMVREWRIKQNFEKACLANDIPGVESYLAHNPDLLYYKYELSEKGDMPILFFAKSVAVAKLLLRHRAKISNSPYLYSQVHSGTVVHHACKHDCDADLLRYYLQHLGINVNDRQSYLNRTPLHYWAEYAVPRDRSNIPETIANSLIIFRAQEKFKILQEYGADLHTRDGLGFSAYHLLLLNRRYSRASQATKDSLVEHAKEFEKAGCPGLTLSYDAGVILGD